MYLTDLWRSISDGGVENDRHTIQLHHRLAGQKNIISSHDEIFSTPAEDDCDVSNIDESMSISPCCVVDDDDDGDNDDDGIGQ